ncbi:MAG TPA: TetR/AcrR family transcriptional regulator [Nevskiaceae bacterium]|nr:TetR/AcrR family transcriptional regulator [Nevskiaceae bacterium]
MTSATLSEPAARPRHDLSRFSKRRIPVQRRSRSTVENIKQAAVALGAEEGFRNLTTDRIAERAGVNIGSLYQYFPNRESILLAVYEDASSRMVERMRQMTTGIYDAPLPKAAERAMDDLLGLYTEYRLILLDLVAEVPELGRAANPVSFMSLHRGTVRNFIQHRVPGATRQTVERMAFFIERIAIGAIRDFLLDPPETLTRKAFVADLAWIVQAYIARPRGRTPR